MIKHIVMWKVCKDGTREDRESVYYEFSKKTAYLKTIIPEIISAHVGYNVVEGDIYHICIDSTFENQTKLESYINHPEHLLVREYMNSVSFAKVVFDYEY